MTRRCEKTGVVIGYDGPKYGNGWQINSVCYLAWVQEGLSKAGLFISAGWVDDQYHRIMLHRDMGLAPDQSVEELRPFAEAQKKPLYDDRADFRFLMEKSRELTAKHRKGG